MPIFDRNGPDDKDRNACNELRGPLQQVPHYISMEMYAGYVEMMERPGHFQFLCRTSFAAVLKAFLRSRFMSRTKDSFTVLSQPCRFEHAHCVSLFFAVQENLGMYVAAALCPLMSDARFPSPDHPSFHFIFPLSFPSDAPVLPGESFPKPYLILLYIL